MTESMNSPFAAQLGTNFVPSDTECDQIRADLAPRLVQLELLNERIRELVEERDKLQTYIDSHAALISNPRRLPADIVRTILVACLPTDWNAVMSTREAPLLVSRICSAWRMIALTTPKLWASIHIPFDFILKRPEQRIPAISRWLQLSGVLPISISLVAPRPGEMSVDTLDTISALIDCVVESAGRWDRMKVLDLSEATVRLARTEAPLLQSFEAVGPISVLNQLDGSPSLRTLIVDLQTDRHFGVHTSQSFNPPCSWHKLTHLTVRALHRLVTLKPTNVLQLLQRFPRLVSFHFSPNATQDWDQYTASKPIPLPYLESLCLIGSQVWDLRSVGRLLDSLFAPGLRQLHIPTIPSPDQNILPNFIDSLSRIDDIQIRLPSYTTDMILATLGGLSNLTKLAVSARDHFPDWQDFNANNVTIASCTSVQFLHLLTPSCNGGIVLCPNLQNLQFDDFASVPKETLEQFIWERLDLGVGYRRLAVGDWQKHSLFSPDEIQTFQLRGVEISWPISPWGTEEDWLGRVTPWTGLSGTFPIPSP